MNHSIPTQADFELPPRRIEDLDGWSAWDHFGGRTLEEAYAIFKENPLYYSEDLMWMAPKAFCFYLPIALRYLQSEESAGDGDAVSCLASAIEFHFECDQDVSAAHPCILEICDYVSEHYSKFAIEESIYGDLRPEYERLRQWVKGEKPVVPDVEIDLMEVDKKTLEKFRNLLSMIKQSNPSQDVQDWAKMMELLLEVRLLDMIRNGLAITRQSNPSPDVQAWVEVMERFLEEQEK